MKIAIFGDFSSAYSDLKLFFKQTEKNIDLYYCTGDMLHHNSPEGFTWNNDIVKMLNDYKVLCVAGNHEKWLLEIINGIHKYRGRAKYYKKRNLKKFGGLTYNKDTKNFLLNLNEQEEIDDILLTHYSATGKFMLRPRKEEFEILKKKEKKILFFGHSHKRLHFQEKKDYPVIKNYFDRKRFFPKFNKEYDISEGLHLVNPGNLHRSPPTSGFNECSSYVIYDNETKKIMFKRLEKNQK